MGTTPVYALPYPALTDAPNGPAQLQSLATAVETQLSRIDTDATSKGRGLVKWGQRTTASLTTTTEVGVLRVDGISLVAGRQYRIWTSPLHMDSTVTNDEIRSRLRYNTAGTATTASAGLPGAMAHVRQTDANVSEDKSITVTYTPATNETMSLLLTVARIAGTGNVSLVNAPDAENTVQLMVEDIGPAQAQSGVVL